MQQRTARGPFGIRKLMKNNRTLQKRLLALYPLIWTDRETDNDSLYRYYDIMFATDPPVDADPARLDRLEARWGPTPAEPVGSRPGNLALLGRNRRQTFRVSDRSGVGVGGGYSPPVDESLARYNGGSSPCVSASSTPPAVRRPPRYLACWRLQVAEPHGRGQPT